MLYMKYQSSVVQNFEPEFFLKYIPFIPFGALISPPSTIVLTTVISIML